MLSTKYKVYNFVALQSIKSTYLVLVLLRSWLSLTHTGRSAWDLKQITFVYIYAHTSYRYIFFACGPIRDKMSIIDIEFFTSVLLILTLKPEKKMQSKLLRIRLSGRTKKT